MNFMSYSIKDSIVVIKLEGSIFLVENVGDGSIQTFLSTRNLAIGIGIQNFPEGLAVSLPLRASGMSVWKSFW